MPKFLIQGTYTQAGVKGLQSAGGTARRDAVAHLVESVGGSMECFYFAFGDDDVYVVADVPDAESMAGIALTVNASGAVTIKTTVLMTPEEVDAAAQKSIDYRPPGS